MMGKALGAHYVHVEVSQAGGDWQRHANEGRGVHSPSAEKVKQGPIFVIVRDQPELCPCAVVCEINKIC